MADYAPVALPGQTYTLQAGAAISGGDLVVVSADNTVIRAAALASTAFVGVAAHDAANGAKVTVILAKAVHESIADGTVAAGDQLTTTNTASRQVKALAAVNVDVTGTPSEATIETAINTSVNQARGVIGTALTGGADNTLVRWVQR